jgi:hypothetical protein
VVHHDRATPRVGGVFPNIDADQSRSDVEVQAMTMAPIPTPRQVLWRKPPVLALTALPGTAVGRLGEPAIASATVWATAGAMLRDAPCRRRRGEPRREGIERRQRMRCSLRTTSLPRTRRCFAGERSQAFRLASSLPLKF